MENVLSYADLLAWVILNKLGKEKDYSEFSKTNKWYSQIIDEFDGGNTKDIHHLKDFIEKHKTDTRTTFWLTVAELIDYYYVDTYPILHEARTKRDTPINIVPLNTYGIKDISIFPHPQETMIHLIDGVYNKKWRPRGYLNMINSYFHNYLVIYSYQLTGFEVRVTNYENHDLKQRMIDNEGLKILFFPFSSKPVTDVYTPYFNKDEMTFGFTHNKAQDQLAKARFETSLRNYDFVKNKPDIIMFPEMYLNESIRNRIPSLLNEIRVPNPCLFIAGTEWNHQENVCYVYNQFGDQIVSQKKYTPFKWKNPDNNEVWKEDIGLNGKKQVVHLLDISGIGRIAFFICKDMKDAETMSLLRLFDVDFIFVPAYTPSWDVSSMSNELSQEYHCISIYSNACAAKKTKEVSRIFVPNKVNSERTYRKISVRKSRCRKKICDSYCKGVTYFMSFKKI